jgi:hypothetical protein
MLTSLVEGPVTGHGKSESEREVERERGREGERLPVRERK